MEGIYNPSTRFPLTEGGQEYLGLEITGDAARGWVHVSQETYAKKVVEKFGFSDSKRVPTPMHATFHAGDVDTGGGGSRRPQRGLCPRLHRVHGNTHNAVVPQRLWDSEHGRTAVRSVAQRTDPGCSGCLRPRLPG